MVFESRPQRLRVVDVSGMSFSVTYPRSTGEREVTTLPSISDGERVRTVTTDECRRE